MSDHRLAALGANEEPVPRARGDAQGDDGSPSGGTAAPVTSTDPHPRKSF